MNHRSRLHRRALVAVVAVAVLAGCSGDDSGATDTTTVAATASASERTVVVMTGADADPETVAVLDAYASLAQTRGHEVLRHTVSGSGADADPSANADAVLADAVARDVDAIVLGGLDADDFESGFEPVVPALIAVFGIDAAPSVGLSSSFDVAPGTAPDVAARAIHSIIDAYFDGTIPEPVVDVSS